MKKQSRNGGQREMQEACVPIASAKGLERQPQMSRVGPEEGRWCFLPKGEVGVGSRKGLPLSLQNGIPTSHRLEDCRPFITVGNIWEEVFLVLLV